MIFRNATSQFLRDKSLSPILNPIFFDTDTGRTLSLSATDIIDSLSATAQTIASLSFNTNDVIDSTEQNINVIVSSALSVPGAKDTIESSAENIVSTSLTVIDSIDTAEITSQLDRLLSLDATDTTDKAVIRIDSGQSKKKRPAGAAINWNEILPLLQHRNASFTIKESSDTAQMSAIAESKMSAVINETGDGIKFISRPLVVAQVAMQEAQDITYVDEVQARINSDKIYSDYDADLMAIFAMAS